MTANEAADKKYQSFAKAFFSALAEALTEACGAPWKLGKEIPAEFDPEESEPVWSKFSLAGSVRGECILGIRRAEAVMVAAQVTQQIAIEFGDEQAEAYLKIMQATAEKLVGTAAQEYGTFTAEVVMAAEPPEEMENTSRATATDSDSNSIGFVISLNPELSEALFLHSQVENAMAAATVQPTADGRRIELPDDVNLDLVMDVELNVTLRFGKRQLSLREVMDLTTGSVVELDRQVEEPVELLLDGNVIARGEAVVIDGNYGLRVTEVAQPVPSVRIR